MMAPPLLADLSGVSDSSFTVSHTAEVKAQPFVAWRTMTSHIGEWWSKDHSWSGDSDNLYMKVERNGCFCEKLPGGGNVEHLRIIYFAPGTEVRFDGALGPLQTMPVNGRMIWKIEKTEGGSSVTFIYHVSGHPEGGLEVIAPAVDTVIGEQLINLQKRLDWD
jgi:hypothetical protein